MFPMRSCPAIALGRPDEGRSEVGTKIPGIDSGSVPWIEEQGWAELSWPLPSPLVSPKHNSWPALAMLHESQRRENQ